MIFHAPTHFVRVGTFGHVGRFCPVEPVLVDRGRQVVCRTSRGLEVGEVLGHVRSTISTQVSDGSLLRPVSPTDELVLRRLRKNRDEAFESCRVLLSQSGSSAVLMDVEQLFDGATLYFYFLGQPPTELESLLQPLAAAYESRVKLADFVRAAEIGCGPNCGTEAAEGCGESCSGCAVASACHRG